MRTGVLMLRRGAAGKGQISSLLLRRLDFNWGIRRSESVPNTGTETEAYYGSPPPMKEKGRPKSKWVESAICTSMLIILQDGLDCRLLTTTYQRQGAQLQQEFYPNDRRRSYFLPFWQLLRSVFRAAKSFKPAVVVISSDSDEYEDTPRAGLKQNAKSRYDSLLLLGWLSLLPNSLVYDLHRMSKKNN